jgi:UDP-N-acetylmuramyl-tripeptide synthetase
VDECEFDVGIFTTLTPDHLDYHETFDAYREAKGRLFEMLDSSQDKGAPKAAVLNADDPAWEYFRSRTHEAIWTYGINNPAAIRAAQLESRGMETRFRLETPLGTRATSIRMPGRFNVSNALAAAACALSQGVELDLVADAIANLKAPEGRMEVIEGRQPFTVIVDFAATPDALRKSLGAARPLVDQAAGGRLIVLFGCAGERDPGRRTGMGAAAAELADLAVFTNEDPRSEDPDAIIRQIAGAFVQRGRPEDDYRAIPDRREAIRAAFSMARNGDVVLLCGKATEPFIEIAGARLPWDERGFARDLLVELYG